MPLCEICNSVIDYYYYFYCYIIIIMYCLLLFLFVYYWFQVFAVKHLFSDCLQCAWWHPCNESWRKTICGNCGKIANTVVKTVELVQLYVCCLQAVASLGWQNPLPIQEQAIPFALQGKDILVRARTGSGKTAAYAIPVVQKVLSTKQVDGIFTSRHIT